MSGELRVDCYSVICSRLLLVAPSLSSIRTNPRVFLGGGGSERNILCATKYCADASSLNHMLVGTKLARNIIQYITRLGSGVTDMQMGARISSVCRFFPGGGKNHGKNRKKPPWKK